MATIQLNVEGMSCGNCVKSIESNVGQLAGVETVQVNLQEKHVSVQFDDQQSSIQTITETIESLGFDVV